MKFGKGLPQRTCLRQAGATKSQRTQQSGKDRNGLVFIPLIMTGSKKVSGSNPKTFRYKRKK
jgi:hypothetical protein